MRVPGPTLQELADRVERCRSSQRPVLGETSGELPAADLGVLGRAMERERPLHRPTGHRVDADRHPDLEHTRPPFAKRSLSPQAHDPKIGSEVGTRVDPYLPAGGEKLGYDQVLFPARSEGFEPPTF